jgi:hypothetical protein
VLLEMAFIFEPKVKVVPGRQMSKFFKSSLLFGVGFCNQRVRLAPAETQPPEQPLALTETELDLEFPGKVMTEKFPVPEVLGVSQLARRAAQTLANGSEHGVVQSKRPCPGRRLSSSPAKPLFSKRCTQDCTVQGLCPKSFATWPGLKPEQTNKIP